jgi:hypothetical protein
MKKNSFAVALCGLVVVLWSTSHAQQPKIYRVGVITAGGAWYATIDGLRAGLKELGLKTPNK